METSVPPSRNDIGPVVRRQVVARAPSQKKSRPLRRGRLLFLVFCALFLLVVLLLIAGD